MSTTSLVYHPLASCCWCRGRFIYGKMHGSMVWLCENRACQDRQIARSLVYNKNNQQVLLYMPLPRQVDFEEACEQTCTIWVNGHPVKMAKYVLYGGAAGGTKSHALRWRFIRLCLQIEGFSALLLRRNLTELKETHIQRVERECALFGAKLNKTDNVLNFPRGSRLKFGHLDDPKDVTKYLSTEYDSIGFDELVTFPQSESLLIMSRARSTKPAINAGVVAGTNPGGPESYWVKRYWLDKNITPDEDPTYDPENYIYLPATLEDNPYLGPEYERGLLRLPEELRRAYRMGDWDIFPGQFFSEWRRDQHVVPAGPPPEGRWYVAVDWGYMAPGVALFVCVTPEGRVIIHDEYVFRMTIASDVAKGIKRKADELGIPRISGVGDTEMGKPQTDSGESIFETFARFHVNLRPADKSRVAGWQRLRHWLRPAPDGDPWLQVSENCPYLIRTIPALIMDDKSPEDIADGLEDHAGDALRYFVQTRPAPEANWSKIEPPKGSPAWLLRQEEGPSTARHHGQVS